MKSRLSYFLVQEMLFEYYVKNCLQSGELELEISETFQGTAERLLEKKLRAIFLNHNEAVRGSLLNEGVLNKYWLKCIQLQVIQFQIIGLNL